MSGPLSRLTPSNPRRTGGEIVAAFVRELIFSGQLAPGDRVPQREVARLLSLSKIPVREGLIALERDGLVTFGADRGAIVSRLDRGTIEDAFAILGVVYGYAAKCGLERSGDALVDRVNVLDPKIRKTTDEDEMRSLADAFHKAVLWAADSQRINVILRANARMGLSELFRQLPGILSIEAQGIAAISRALRQRDPAKADTQYQRLMRREGRAVAAELDRRGLFAERES